MENILNSLEINEEKSSIIDLAASITDLVFEQNSNSNDEDEKQNPNSNDKEQNPNSNEEHNLTNLVTEQFDENFVEIENANLDKDFESTNQLDFQEDLIEKIDEIFDDDILNDIDNDSSNTTSQQYDDNDDVVLETVQDDSIIYESVIYPCLIIKGVESVEEVEFLKRFCVDSSNTKSIFLYCFTKNDVAEIGYVKLSLNFLLILERMPNYKVVLLQSKNGKTIEVDLHNPEDLAKFISI